MKATMVRSVANATTNFKCHPLFIWMFIGGLLSSAPIGITLSTGSSSMVGRSKAADFPRRGSYGVGDEIKKGSSLLPLGVGAPTRSGRSFGAIRRYDSGRPDRVWRPTR